MKPFLFFISIFLGASAFAQTDTISIVSYNLLNFPDSRNDCGASLIVPNRFDTLRKILSYTKPDIFVACEIQNKKGADSILSRSLNVFGNTNYAAANYHANSSGGNLQNMMYYNTNKLVLHSQDIVETNGRDIDHYILYVLDPNLATYYDTTFLEVYMCHLKAGSGSSEQATRNTQTTILRDFIDARPQNRNHFVCGDLNVYRSTEACYQTLISGGANPLIDPISSPGSWNNNSSFSSIHTQSTRSGQSLDCGSQGGSDDRFDQILVSGSVMNGSDSLIYLDGSYDAIGNDGNHFNGSLISSLTNSLYPDSVINALYYMSDHLPVTLKAVITYPTSNGLAISPSVTPASCNGTSDGSITINPNAGQAPYTYLWDLQAGGQTTQTIDNLAAGVYCVTVTDALLEDDNICVTVGQPEGLTINLFQSSDNGGCDGTAIAVISGGVGPFTYLWDDEDAQTTESAENLCAGDYSVVVTDDRGCQTNAQVTVGGATNAIDEMNGFNLHVFPNPFNESFQVTFDLELMPSRIQLINTIGEILIDVDATQFTQTSYTISTKKIQAGSYYLSIESSSETVIKKLIKY